MFLVPALLALPNCGDRAGKARPNVLLVSVDTLRADRLGGYGYPRPTSPRIDEFLAGAVTFDDAHVHAPWTMPSLASWLTSLPPSAHGVSRFDSLLAAEFETLPEMLRAEGYRTIGVLAQVFLQKKYGLVQGIDELKLPLRVDSDGGERPLRDRATSQEVARLAIRAFEGLRGETRPWLLWLHFFDPHESYRTHPGISESFGIRTPSDRYDGEVRYTDHYVGQVLDGLAHFGFADDTIVVFFSDHGEEFGEHGGNGHGQSLHEELIRTPFAIRVPGIAPRRVGETVGAIDLVPTLLDLVGSARPRSTLEGRSLVPLLEGGALPREPILLELAKERQFDGLIFGRHKLIVEKLDGVDTSFRLYDRAADPHETNDLSASEPRLVEKMRSLLESTRGRARRHARGGDARFELSETDRELMRQLGYFK